MARPATSIVVEMNGAEAIAGSIPTLLNNRGNVMPKAELRIMFKSIAIPIIDPYIGVLKSINVIIKRLIDTPKAIIILIPISL